MGRSAFEEQWRRRFILRGQRFDDDAGIAGWSSSGLDVRLRHFQAVWRGGQAGSRWLDVGCGAGSYTRYLHESGVAAVGLDYSQPSVQKAAARGEPGQLWVVGDATSLPFRSDSVAGILCFGVLQALESPDAVVRELLRVLRPGGELWLDALNAHALPTLARRLVAWARRRGTALRYDRPRELTALLEGSGGVQVRVHWLPILPARIQSMQRLVDSVGFRRALGACPHLGQLLAHAVVISARKADP